MAMSWFRNVSWRNVMSQSSEKTQNGRKTPAIFVNLKVNTLLCTIHDIFVKDPHIDIEIWRMTVVVILFIPECAFGQINVVSAVGQHQR